MSLWKNWSNIASEDESKKSDVSNALSSLTAADRREEDRSWHELVLFLGHLGGIVGNLPLLGAGLAVANRLLNRVLSMRTVLWGAHARIDKVITFALLALT